MDDVVVSNRYCNYRTGIPHPATFTLRLGERLSTGATAIRVYNNLPFKNRHRRDLDAFGKAALDSVGDSSSTTHTALEEDLDSCVLRYAGAMVIA